MFYSHAPHRSENYIYKRGELRAHKFFFPVEARLTFGNACRSYVEKIYIVARRCCAVRKIENGNFRDGVTFNDVKISDA